MTTTEFAVSYRIAEYPDVQTIVVEVDSRYSGAYLFSRAITKATEQTEATTTEIVSVNKTQHSDDR